ncbi:MULTISPECIES: hypothetical protein [Streptomyces]|uniref:hypothetical protein n=1 Tax=Streptomyces TaxID=1883 RepID=UPI002047DE1F|nr:MULTISPECIES: hypothetical protein [Streptomyces]UPT41772.1 hypothetical protein MWG59_10225 [Streptomyces sp. WAC00303]WIY76004.1 hypothetical protein QPM16_10085 [Streptomyces anulatus]
MATSAAPAAIDALLAILRAAPGLEGVAVVDGPSTINFTEKDRIYVGWAEGADQAAEIQQSFANAGARRRNEDAVISCYAESRGGDKDMRLRRNRVFELLAEVENALRGTAAAPEAPTLNGAVLWSELSTGSLSQAQTGSGPMASLDFTVAYRARI